MASAWDRRFLDGSFFGWEGSPRVEGIKACEKLCDIGEILVEESIGYVVIVEGKARKCCVTRACEELCALVAFERAICGVQSQKEDVCCFVGEDALDTHRIAGVLVAGAALIDIGAEVVLEVSKEETAHKERVGMYRKVRGCDLVFEIDDAWSKRDLAIVFPCTCQPYRGFAEIKVRKEHAAQAPLSELEGAIGARQLDV